MTPRPAFSENSRHGRRQIVVKSSKHISELFQSVTAKLTPILRYDFSQLVLYDSTTGQLTTRGSYFPKGKGLIPEGLLFPIRDSPAGRVFTTGRPMRMNKTENLPRSDLIERLLAEGVRSGCCVPLRSGSTIIGTFNIGSIRTHAFNSETEQLLMAVGTDLGELLERVSPHANGRLASSEAGQIPFSAATNNLLASALIGRVLAGDAALFHELIRPYEKVVYSIAYSILSDHAEAEEVSQETLLKALTHLRQLHSPAKFRQWLLQIALNEARIRRRQNKKYVHEPLDLPEQKFSFPSPPANDPIEQRETHAALRHGLFALPPSYREVIILHDIQERSVAETAIALGISIGNVKTRLHRARKALRRALPPLFPRTA